MTLFRLLSLRRFWEHRARTLLSLGGIAVGSALVVAVLALLGSLTGSVETFIGQLSGAADLEIASVSGEGFEEHRFFDIEQTPGVSAAVPMVATKALIDRRQALLVGVDQRVSALGTGLSARQQARLVLQSGKPGVFLGKRLAQETGQVTGATVQIIAGASGAKKVPVLGIIEESGPGFNAGLYAVAPIPVAQGLAGKPGKIDTVFVVAGDDYPAERLRSDLASKLGPAFNVDSPSARAREARSTTASLRFGMLLGVTIALIVGGFLIFNTMSMAALERRRELATVRALGGSRRQLLVLFVLEAALIGLAGSAAGSLVGLALAGKLIDAIPSFYTSRVEVTISLHVPSMAIPGALAAGVVASIAAAFLPARKAVAVSPADSMRPEGVLESLDFVEGISWKPAVGGAAIAAAGFFTAVAGPSSVGFLGMGAFMAGNIIWTYGLTHPLARATARLAGLLGVAGKLAAAGLERSPRRAWATAVAIIAGVGMVVAQFGATRNLTQSVSATLESLEAVDLHVSAVSGTSLATEVLLPDRWSADLASLAGVENVASTTFVYVTMGGRRVLVQGVANSVGAEPATAGLPPAQRRAVEAGEAAVVSTRFEELYGRGKGDVLILPTPTGARRLPIIATFSTFTWEGGVIGLGRGVVGDWFRRNGVSDYLLTYKPGADPRRVRAEVQRFVAQSGVVAYISSGTEYLELVRATIGQISRLFDALAAVVVVAAMMAIFNALLISVIERKRELGIIRAVGSSRRQMRRMVAVEALSLGVVGGLIGVLVGFAAHRAAIAAVARQAGMPIFYGFVLLPAVAAFGVGIAMAVGASIEPARRAGSLNIIESIGYE